VKVADIFNMYLYKIYDDGIDLPAVVGALCHTLVFAEHYMF